jgi:glycosyltransferase involved in cell wall biosynthesis
MKVLHLINNLRREGAQVVVFNMLTSGAGAPDQAVCVREPGGALQPELQAHGVRVFAPDRYYGAAATRRSLQFIDEIMERERIDLVHAHMADAAFLGWRAAVRHRVPLIITCHGPDILPNCGGGWLCRAVYGLLLAAAARYAACNVAVSPAVAEVVRRRLGLAPERVSVIANGVPLPERGANCAPERGAGRWPRVVTVGRLVELKRQEQLVEAGAALATHYPGIEVVIVGDGPRRELLRETARALNFGDGLTMTGVVADVSGEIRRCDVYVSTSRIEGLPMALLEAMACEVPVVASDIPGNRSVIRHGETGLLYPAGDVAALVAAIREVIEAPAAAQARAARARSEVEQHYSAAACARAYQQLYADALCRGPPQAQRQGAACGGRVRGRRS